MSPEEEQDQASSFSTNTTAATIPAEARTLIDGGIVILDSAIAATSSLYGPSRAIESPSCADITDQIIATTSKGTMAAAAISPVVSIYGPAATSPIGVSTTITAAAESVATAKPTS
ncbi:hypothetical protein TI39_contig4142g00008 [Zymoseptoria brevis]|uniref:Uncharacterized protein n=1 Tax=Zymoseptoria brevis TaxID=1047168 RepID=A0A0F4GC92_9PEZI|nr:hypothetical protein TI39_contig4142g00008 [Zymoseptoria brevis]